MLRDTAVDLIMKRLGNRTGADLQQDVINELVTAQADVLEADPIVPWFLLSEESNAQTTVGDERVELPADFIMPWEYGFLYRYDAALDDPYIEMSRDDWGHIKMVNNFSGIPTHYDISGNYIFMRPVADAIYPLRMRYMARGASLAGAYGDAANIENVWLKHAADWLMGTAGAVIADQYEFMKPEIVKKFTLQAARGRETVRIRNVALEESNKEQVQE
jgi:hypothetical protein